MVMGKVVEGLNGVTGVRVERNTLVGGAVKVIIERGWQLDSIRDKDWCCRRPRRKEQVRCLAWCMLPTS
jgi:hypothetical protein